MIKKPRKPRDTQEKKVLQALEEFKQEYLTAHEDFPAYSVQDFEKTFWRHASSVCHNYRFGYTSDSNRPICHRFYYNNQPGTSYFSFWLPRAAPRKNSTVVDALHVAAHIRTDYANVALHGPEFISTLKQLVEKELGAHWRRRLHAIVRTYGIKTKTWPSEKRDNAKLRSTIRALTELSEALADENSIDKTRSTN